VTGQGLPLHNKLCKGTEGLEVGTTVRYYFNGWRIGHLEEIKGKLARIRPMAAYDHNPRCRWVPLTDEGTQGLSSRRTIPRACVLGVSAIEAMLTAFVRKVYLISDKYSVTMPIGWLKQECPSE
jgi:hypothetical protein